MSNTTQCFWSPECITSENLRIFLQYGNIGYLWLIYIYFMEELTCIYIYSMPSSENSRWMYHKDGSYSINWENPTQESVVRHNVSYLLKLWKNWTKGLCRSKLKSVFYRPGCQCIGCAYVLLDQTTQHEHSNSSKGNESGTSDMYMCVLVIEWVTVLF